MSHIHDRPGLKKKTQNRRGAVDSHRMQKIRCLLVPVLFCLANVNGHAGQLSDVLRMRAPASERSIHSLLLDVTRAGNRFVAVGENGYILYSDDRGEHWRQASVPVRVTLTSVVFPTPEKGWAVGHDAVILHSRDGGVTWTKQLDGWETGEILLAASQGWAKKVRRQIEVAGETDELMAGLEAAEVAIDEAKLEIEVGPRRPLLDVWFKDIDTGFAVGAFGYFFTTSDGGKTWLDSSPATPNPELLNLYSIVGLSDSTMLIAGELGLLLRSADGGRSWRTVVLDYDGTLFGVYPGLTRNDVFVLGLRGNVFHSSDSGFTWTRLATALRGTLLGMATMDDQTVMVGTGGRILICDFNRSCHSDLARADRIDLASVLVTGENILVLTGQAGLVRMALNGDDLPVYYETVEAR